MTCKVLSQAAKQSAPKDESSSQSLPKWVEWADEGSSVGFLLMCLFVHLLYGVDGFHWSHKCCLTVGAALAISTILNGSSRCDIKDVMPIKFRILRAHLSFSTAFRNTPPQILTPKHSNTSMLPKLQFSLTVHRCRIKMEGTEYLYPNDKQQPSF